MELESNLALRTSHVRNNKIVHARHRPNLGALWPLRNCFRSNKKRLPALELFFGGAYIRNYTVAGKYRSRDNTLYAESSHTHTVNVKMLHCQFD